MLVDCPVCGVKPTIKSSHVDERVWLDHSGDCQLRRREQYMTAADAEHGWRKTCQYWLQRNMRTERKTMLDRVITENE